MKRYSMRRWAVISLTKRGDVAYLRRGAASTVRRSTDAEVVLFDRKTAEVNAAVLRDGMGDDVQFVGIVKYPPVVR